MEYVPKYENKVQYIVNLIKNIKNINILELGVREGISTKCFLEVCKKNNGNLTSIDIDDCSGVSNDTNWKFIHSSDDNFEFIDNQITKNLDFIYIDSYHEPLHVEKVFYHYYEFLKINGICVIGHGSSKALSVVSALRLAHSAASHGVMDDLAQLQKSPALSA